MNEKDDMNIVLKIKFGFLSLILLVCWGCSSLNENRRFSGSLDGGLIGPEAKVFLFYRENNDIIFKQCKDYTVLESRSDCESKVGTSVWNVPVSDFKRSLKAALKLPGDYDARMKEKIKVYHKGQDNDIEELQKEQGDLTFKNRACEEIYK